MGEPRERAVLFSGPMVRALLDGRKSQTRRLIKPQPPDPKAVRARAGDAFSPHLGRDGVWRVVGPVWAVRELLGSEPAWRCPYGQPGDRLWVREAWALEDLAGDGERLVWRADREAAWRSSMASRFYLPSDYLPDRWRPSIHMPRWASRLTLEVTSVRVERLQDVSEEDARAEGLELDDRTRPGHRPDLWFRAFDTSPWRMRGVSAFQDLWWSINGPESWKANPWVWVVSFTLVEAA